MVAMRALIAVGASLVALACSPASVAQDAESQVYAAAKTCTGLNAYLRAYPAGRFKTDAEARIAKDCPTTASQPTPPKPATTPKPTSPKPPFVPAADPCTKARTEWTQISMTQDTAALRSYISGLPSACSTQKTQAQARLDSLQAAANDAKRKLWFGVPEFDGVWVLDASSPNAGCGNFPWRYSPNGQYIRRIYGNGDTRDMRVESTSPPALHVRENNKGRAVIEGQRMRIEDKDGKLDCYLKRQ